MTDHGETNIHIDVTIEGGFRWGRNRVSTTVDTTNHVVSIERFTRGRAGVATTNALDDLSLRTCIETADTAATAQPTSDKQFYLPGPQSYSAPVLYSAESAALDAARRSSIGEAVVKQSEARSFLSAGSLTVAARAVCVINNQGGFAFSKETYASYSLTVRDPAERASGWAGRDAYDWDKMNSEALTHTAIEKCAMSAQPRAVEPGRYTAVLEPRAVADMMSLVIGSLSRLSAEAGIGPWAGEIKGTTKIGQHVMDERVTLLSDPMDPDGAFHPFDEYAIPIRRTVWIERGVLKNLAGYEYHTTPGYVDTASMPSTHAFRMAGGDSSLDEMIVSTERGVLVTRFGILLRMNGDTLVSMGHTRDGFWLIEKGKIRHPIKNFRFFESPLFIFNKLDQIGRPERVLSRRWNPRVVPPVRVRDFNFTQLIDAV
jgi:predicted Zn-dependent protease